MLGEPIFSDVRRSFQSFDEACAFSSLHSVPQDRRHNTVCTRGRALTMATRRCHQLSYDVIKRKQSKRLLHSHHILIIRVSTMSLPLKPTCALPHLTTSSTELQHYLGRPRFRPPGVQPNPSPPHFHLQSPLESFHEGAIAPLCHAGDSLDLLCTVDV